MCLSSVWGRWVNWWPSVGLTIRPLVWPPCGWRRRSPRCPSLKTLNCDTHVRPESPSGFILLSVKAHTAACRTETRVDKLWSTVTDNPTQWTHKHTSWDSICNSIFQYSWRLFMATKQTKWFNEMHFQTLNSVQHRKWNIFIIFWQMQHQVYRPVVSLLWEPLKYVLVKYECKYWMSWVTEKCFLVSHERLYRMFCFMLTCALFNTHVKV